MVKTKKKSDDSAKGRVTGGMWMGRVITAAQKLAYGLGHGTGSIVASGQAAMEGLMKAIENLALGDVSKAQAIGSMISKSAGAQFEKLKGLDQKPFADADAPSLAGMLANAFAVGAKDGELSVRRAKRRAKGKATETFSSA